MEQPYQTRLSRIPIGDPDFDMEKSKAEIYKQVDGMVSAFVGAAFFLGIAFNVSLFMDSYNSPPQVPNDITRIIDSSPLETISKEGVNIRRTQS